ncbi:hypothetical protein NDU88_007199 [Pleurodeles waltl]|uniref:Uncharacterized protein n=1 Tax=Pleurodeles waltl TaxID=8319 RepID=A0AAV7NXA7_PLEWA|nr:hypothetical protein NDU88_007199 [Pleurodeles waltl]
MQAAASIYRATAQMGAALAGSPAVCARFRASKVADAKSSLPRSPALPIRPRVPGRFQLPTHRRQPALRGAAPQCQLSNHRRLSLLLNRNKKSSQQEQRDGAASLQPGESLSTACGAASRVSFLCCGSGPEEARGMRCMRGVRSLPCLRPESLR